MKANRQTKPRARKERLVIQELPDEVLVYDLDRDRAHCLNQTAAFVWQHCDGRTTTKQIARALREKVDAPVDEKMVWLALDQLGRNHLLAEIAVSPSTVLGMSRREVVRTLGLSAVVVVPVVASIVAPTPAQAATCLPGGASCSSSPQCCSNFCNDGTCAPT